MARCNWILKGMYMEACLVYRRVSFFPHRTKRSLWADHGPRVLPTDTVKRPPKIMARRMVSYHRLYNLAPPASRGRTFTADHYAEEIIGKTATPAIRQREKRGSPSERSLCRTCRVPILAGRRADTSSSQDAGMVPVALPGILVERRVAREQLRPVKN